MPNVNSFYNLPEVSFIEDLTMDDLLNQAIVEYEKKYSELTGENKVLYPADPMRILIQTYVLKLYQLHQFVDRAGKQDLLKYSEGAFLEHIAALRGVTRLPAQSATTTILFKMSTALSQTVIIPVGTLVTAGDNIFFATTAAAEIPSGSLQVEIPVVCTTPGLSGNGYSPGRLNTLVQPFPYAMSVANTTVTTGGVEAESDQSLSERTFLAPSGYSVAGPDDAYIYWVKSFSQYISDVNVYSPEAGVVDIRVLLQNGELPTDDFLHTISDYLEQNHVRPLTDHVLISSPEIVPYDIDCTYYIRSSDRNNLPSIQKRLNTALSQYILWQESKIGRDINPSVLHLLLMESGIKRMDIRKPSFITIPQTRIGKSRHVNVVSGGYELD